MSADPMCPKCHGQGFYVENPEAIGNPDMEPVYVVCECTKAGGDHE